MSIDKEKEKEKENEIDCIHPIYITSLFLFYSIPILIYMVSLSTIYCMFYFTAFENWYILIWIVLYKSEKDIQIEYRNNGSRSESSWEKETVWAAVYAERIKTESDDRSKDQKK